MRIGGPEQDLLKLLDTAPPVKLQNRLMTAGDKDLAVALTFLNREERERVLALVSAAKQERIRQALDRAPRLRYGEYRRITLGLLDHLKGQKPQAASRTYYRPPRGS